MSYYKIFLFITQTHKPFIKSNKLVPHEIQISIHISIMYQLDNGTRALERLHLSCRSCDMILFPVHVTGRAVHDRERRV